MIILLIINLFLYADIRQDIDSAFNIHIRELANIDKNYTQSQAAKALIYINNAEQLLSNIDSNLAKLSKEQSEVLNNKKNYLNQAILHVKQITENGYSNINTQELKEANAKLKLADIRLHGNRKELNEILKFSAIDPKEFDDKLLSITSLCQSKKDWPDLYKKCIIDFLASEIKYAPKNIEFKAIIDACCSSKELDAIAKQHRALRGLAALSTASSLSFGDFNLVSSLLAGATNQYSQKLLNEPFSLYQQQVENFNNIKKLGVNDYQDAIYANANFDMNLGVVSNHYRNSFNLNPNFFDSNGQNNNLRDTSNNLNISTSSTNNFSDTSNNFKTKRGGGGTDTNLGGDNSSSGEEYKDLTPEENFRYNASVVQAKRLELNNTMNKNMDEYAKISVDCILAGRSFKSINCAKKQAELYAKIQVNNWDLRNFQYQLEMLNNLYVENYYTYNFIDIFIEAVSLKSLYATNSKDNKKALNILNLEKPFSFQTAELKPNWQKILQNIIKDFENKAKLAKKEANKHKKNLRALLKIKEPELSVNELHKLGAILESYQKIKDVDAYIISNQKKLNNTIKYNKNFRKDKLLLEKATELNKSYTKLLNTTEETKTVLSDTFFINNDLFNNAIFNIAYRDYASSLLEE